MKDNDESTLETWDNVNITDQDITGEGSPLASATTLVLGTDGNFFHVTGTTTITAIAGSIPRVTLVFDDVLTLAHSGNLVLNGGVDHVTQANEVKEFINDGAGVWREIALSIGQAVEDIKIKKISPLLRLLDTASNEYGIRVESSDFAVLENTNTEASPIWVAQLYYDKATTTWTLSGNTVISGNITIGASAWTSANHTHESTATGGTLGYNAAEITTTNYTTAGYQGNSGITETIALQPKGFWPPSLDPGDANRGNMVIDHYKPGLVDTTTRTIRFTADATGNGIFGASVISYEYWTASERPMVWISYEPDGTIQQIWEAEDPPDGEASRSTAPFSVAPGLAAVEITTLIGARPFITMMKGQLDTSDLAGVTAAVKAAYKGRGMYSQAQLDGMADVEDLWSHRKLDDGQRIWRAQMWLRLAGKAVSGRATATIASILKQRCRYQAGSRRLILR